MRHYVLLIIGLCYSFTLCAQQREKYEFVRNLPAYADSLIADLTYPLAWGNSSIKDFDACFHATIQYLPMCSFLTEKVRSRP